MNQQIDCSFFEAQLNAYLDSELDPETRRKMDQHAKDCPKCGERLESMTRLLTMCAEMDEGLSVPLEAQAAWRKALRNEAGLAKNAPKRKGHAVRRWATGIAAAAVLLVGGTFVYRMDGYMSNEAAYRAYLRAPSENVDYYAGEVLNLSGMPAEETYMQADGEAEFVMEDSAAYAEPESAPAAAAEPVQDVLPENAAVVLRSAHRWIETTGFDQTLQNVEDLVSEYEGYFEQSSVSGQPVSEGGTGRNAEMVARIPSQDLDEFLLSLDAVANVTQKSESAEDISSRYYDSESRLNSYRLQLDRLNEMMRSSADLSDMLLIEDKRTEVQQQIDALESQLKGWNGQAQRSTVHIGIDETEARDQVRPAAQSLTDRVKNAFYDSVNWLRGFIQDAAVVLAMFAPALVVLIPLIVLICLIVSGVKRRKRRKHGK